MKAKIYLLLSSLLVSASSMAQVNKIVEGEIKSNDGKTLKNVTVKVISGNEEYQTVSDNKGKYHLDYLAKDTVWLAYSYVGYVGQEIMLNKPEAKLTHNITMHVADKNLETVTVTAQQAYQTKDKINYLPNNKQVNVSGNGWMLLHNMMLPQLDTNPMTGSINSTNGRDLSLFIDGRKSGAGELSQLRAKDIVRFEYIERPTGLFAGEKTVINVITKKYNSGGYVEARAKQTFITNAGNYSVQSGIDFKRLKLFAAVSGSYNNIDGGKSNSSEYFNLSEKFNRTDNSVAGKIKSNGLGTHLQATYLGHGFNITAVGAMSWFDNPMHTRWSTRSYSPQVDAGTSVVNKSRSKSKSPRLMLSSWIQLSKRQAIRLYSKYSHSDNMFFSSNTDNAVDAFTSITDGNENGNTYNIGANYMNQLSKKTQLTLAFQEEYTCSNVDYAGTNPNFQSTQNNWLYLITGLRHNFSDRFNTEINITLQQIRYKVNGLDSKEYNNIFPEINLGYTINKHSSMYYYALICKTTPWFQRMNDTEVQTDRYMVQRGCPNLGVPTMYDQYLGYNLNVGIWNASANVSYKYLTDAGKRSFTVEGDRIIDYFYQNGDMHVFEARLNNSLRLFNNRLQLSANLWLKRNIYMGQYADSHTHYGGRFMATAFIGHFAMSALFSAQNKEQWGNLMYGKNPCSYDFWVSWGNRGWNATVGCRNIFRTNGHAEQEIRFADYKSSTRNYSETLNGQVYVNLSYSFDFGRKVQKTQKENINTGASRIMTGDVKK